MIALILAMQVTAFVGADVVRSDRAGVLSNQTVIVRGDRIAWVGPAEQAKLDASVTRIDARGKFLLPGFADMHVHLGRREDLVTYLANGITTIRNMWGNPQVLTWRDSVAAGTMVGPRIVTTGPIIDGDPPSQQGMTVITDTAVARAEIEREAAQGYDAVKVYNSVPPAVYRVIMEVAKAKGMPVVGHVPLGVGLHGAMLAGQRSIEHLRGWIAELVPADAPVQPGASLRSRSVAWNWIDTTRIAALVEATKRAGTWNDPTLIVSREMLAPPEQWDSLNALPVYRYLGAGAKMDRSRLPFLQDFTPEDYRESLRGLGMQRRVVLALHRGGAKLLAGTDSPLQGFALADELAEFRKAGLTSWEVLMVATKIAAEYLAETATSGVVAAGARADLQLLSANPVADLSALDARVGVMVRGRWYPKEELQRRLEAIAR
jgi:cytosine/adenosine deaminase-related metal-dependent hydrolase